MSNEEIEMVGLITSAYEKNGIGKTSKKPYTNYTFMIAPSSGGAELKMSTFDKQLYDDWGKNREEVNVVYTRDGIYNTILHVEETGNKSVGKVPVIRPGNQVGQATQNQTTQHLVFSGLTDDALRDVLDKASEQYDTFATQTHRENGKWCAVLFTRGLSVPELDE